MSETHDEGIVERAVLDHWAATGALSPQAYDRVLTLAGIRPDAAAWARFLERLLAAMGTLLVGAGIVFFIAYNWERFDRFGKFALLDLFIVIAVALAWWRGIDSVAGKAALWIATVAAGALLALIGQTYQTGADNYELFLAWGLLALPWTFASNWTPGWVLLLALANLATGFYFGSVFRPQILPFALRGSAIWLAFWGVNALATLLAERFAHVSVAWGGLWLVRLAAALAIGAQTVLAILAIGDPAYRSWGVFATIALTFAGALVLFRYRRVDLVVLGTGALSAIGIIVYFVGRTILRSSYASGSLLVLALLLVGLSAAAAVWLNALAKRSRGGQA